MFLLPICLCVLSSSLSSSKTTTTFTLVQHLLHPRITQTLHSENILLCRISIYRIKVLSLPDTKEKLLRTTSRHIFQKKISAVSEANYLIWSAKTDIWLYVRLYKGHGCSTKCEKRFWSFYFLQMFHQNDISHPSINLWHVSQVWMVTFIAFSYVILCYNDERAFLITKYTPRLLPIQ